MSPERRSYGISLEDVISNPKRIILRDANHVPALIVRGSKKLIITPIPNMPETHDERKTLLRYIGQAAVKIGEIGELPQVFRKRRAIFFQPYTALSQQGRHCKDQLETRDIL